MLCNELAPTLALDGEWEFALGEDALRQDASWRKIQTPGCWEAQGFSKSIDSQRYRRTIFIPTSWNNQIHLPGIHRGQLCLYGALQRKRSRPASRQADAFSLDISAVAHPGQPNTLEIEVYKPGTRSASRYPLRTTLAGFLPDVRDALWRTLANGAACGQ